MNIKDLTEDQIKEQMAILQSRLDEMQKPDLIPEEDFIFGAENKEACNEDEWLAPDDLAKESELEEADISTPISGYEANTVGALISVLKRTCQMTDLVLPRLNPEKKEMIVFDIYSKNGRAVIDLVPGRVDDPQAI